MDELLKILEAAGALFKKYGTRSVTMSDIAKQLGMSKKTLYQFVSNKDDLVDKVAENFIQNDLKTFAQVREEAKDAVEQMIRILFHVEKTIRDINPTLIFDLQRFHSKTWLKFEKYRFDYALGLVQANLQRGIEEGLYRKELSIQIVSRFYLSLLPILSEGRFFPPEEYFKTDIHFEFVNYHIHAISSPKGLELWNTYLEKYQKQTK